MTGHSMYPTSYRQCSRCLMDTSDPAIQFDAQGHCNHCTRYFERVAGEVKGGAEGAYALEAIVDRIRHEGRGKDYDCIAGVSASWRSPTSRTRWTA